MDEDIENSGSTLIRWPFYVANALILGTVVFFVSKADQELSMEQVAICVFAVALSAMMFFVPHLVEYFIAISTPEESKASSGDGLLQKTYLELEGMKETLADFGVKLEKVPSIVEAVAKDALADGGDSPDISGLPQEIADLRSQMEQLVAKPNEPSVDPRITDIVAGVAALEQRVDRLAEILSISPQEESEGQNDEANGESEDEDLADNLAKVDLILEQTQALPEDLEDEEEDDLDEDEDEGESKDEVEEFSDDSDEEESEGSDEDLDEDETDSGEDDLDEGSSDEDEEESTDEISYGEDADELDEETDDESVDDSDEEETDDSDDEDGEEEASEDDGDEPSDEESDDSDEDLDEDETDSGEDDLEEDDESEDEESAEQLDLEPDSETEEESQEESDEFGDDEPSEPAGDPPGVLKGVSQSDVVVAKILPGIGNKVHVRGEGPGLSWDQGVSMSFIEIGKWGWSPSDKSASLVVQLYRNDEEPDRNGKVELEPGEKVEITPIFEE